MYKLINIIYGNIETSTISDMVDVLMSDDTGDCNYIDIGYEIKYKNEFIELTDANLMKIDTNLNSLLDEYSTPIIIFNAECLSYKSWQVFYSLLITNLIKNKIKDCFIVTDELSMKTVVNSIGMYGDYKTKIYLCDIYNKKQTKAYIDKYIIT